MSNDSDRHRIKNWERQRLKWDYTWLYDEILAMLFRHDPIGINFGTNADEYEPEVDTILPRLQEAKSSVAVVRIVYEEFVKWFGVSSAGAQSAYESLAEEIWDAYRLWRG